MKKKRIGMAWLAFASHIDPAASEQQRADMKAVFYAGAACYMGIILANLTEGPDAENEDLDMMQELYQELREFGIVVKLQDTSHKGATN